MTALPERPIQRSGASEVARLGSAGLARTGCAAHRVGPARREEGADEHGQPGRREAEDQK